jgi:hypothetical protein
MPDSLDTRNSVAVLALVAIVLIPGILYYKYGPGSGYRELLESQAALQAATSWRSVAKIPIDTVTSMDSRQREIVCPTDFVDSYADAGNLDKVHRRAFIHGLAYSQRPDGTWMNSPGTSPKLNECGKGPIANGVHLYPDMRRLENGGEVRRGELGHTEHGSCQWLDVYPLAGREVSYSVCIEGSTHLPLEVRFPRSGNEYFYWDWNRTVLIPPVATAMATP